MTACPTPRTFFWGYDETPMKGIEMDENMSPAARGLVAAHQLISATRETAELIEGQLDSETAAIVVPKESLVFIVTLLRGNVEALTRFVEHQAQVDEKLDLILKKFDPKSPEGP